MAATTLSGGTFAVLRESKPGITRVDTSHFYGSYVTNQIKEAF